MAAKSPMQMSLAQMRSQGYVCGIVERRVPGMNITQDLFGFADIVCFPVFRAFGANGVVLIQTTSIGNIAARVKKIRANAEAQQILGAGCGRIIVHGWGRNQFREVEVTL